MSLFNSAYLAAVFIKAEARFLVRMRSLGRLKRHKQPFKSSQTKSLPVRKAVSNLKICPRLHKYERTLIFRKILLTLTR